MTGSSVGTIVSLAPYERLGTNRETATDWTSALRPATEAELEAFETRLKTDDVMARAKTVRERGWRIIRMFDRNGRTISLVDTGGVPVWHVPLSKLKELQGTEMIDYSDIRDITENEAALSSIHGWDIPDDVIADLTHDVDPERALDEAIAEVESEYEMPEGMFRDLMRATRP
jgi:hypothetical protein